MMLPRISATLLAAVAMLPGRADGCAFSCMIRYSGWNYHHIYKDKNEYGHDWIRVPFGTLAECNRAICDCWSPRAATLGQCKDILQDYSYREDASCAVQTGDVGGNAMVCTSTTTTTTTTATTATTAATSGLLPGVVVALVAVLVLLLAVGSIFGARTAKRLAATYEAGLGGEDDDEDDEDDDEVLVEMSNMDALEINEQVARTAE